MNVVTHRNGYKLVNLGKTTLDLEIPRSWNTVKIKDAIKKRSNKIELEPKKKYSRIKVKRRHVGVVLRDNIQGDKILTKNQFKVCSGDYILTHKQVIHGSGGIIPKELDGAVVSGEYSQFYGSDLLDINYFDLFSHTEIFHKMIILTTQGVHIEKFVFLEKEWLNFKLPLPSLLEQQKITSILSNVDNLIESTVQVITHSKKVKTGLMQKLLTRGIDHTKFKKVPWLFGKEIEIPDEWEVKTISELGKIVTGSTPDTTNKKYFGNDFLWASPIDFEGEKYITQTNSMLSEKGLSISRKIPKDAVLVVCIGSTIGKIGMASVEMSTNQQINSIICNNVDSNFIYYQLQQNNYLIKNRSNQSAVPIINKTEFGKFKLILPNEIQKQQKIATILSNIDSKITSQEQYKEKLQKLKKSLMQKLLTGEVRV